MKKLPPHPRRSFFSYYIIFGELNTLELFIMRHGQTADNKKHLLQGRKNIPLSDEGIQQAMNAKADLDAEGIVFDRVCASPLKRAMQTASLITGVAEEDIEPIEEIIEYDFGPLEGKRVEDLGENMRAFFMDPENYVAPEGAETYEQMFERVEGYLKRMEQEDPDERILVVAHGGTLHAMYQLLNGGPMKEMWATTIGNCGYFIASVVDGELAVVDRRFKEENKTLPLDSFLKK